MEDKNQKAIKVYDIIAKDYANKFDPVESDEDLVFLNIFLSYLKLGMNIIDLGCGPGFSAGYFVKKGMKVEGVDLSANMIAIARINYPGIKFSLVDIRKFSPSIPVDSVWAGYSLFNFEQSHLESTLKKIKTYLKSRGVLGIVMQEGVGEIELNVPFFPEKKIYIHLYTKEELIVILEQQGFEVIDQKIKKAIEGEFPYDKILLIARLK